MCEIKFFTPRELTSTCQCRQTSTSGSDFIATNAVTKDELVCRLIRCASETGPKPRQALPKAEKSFFLSFELAAGPTRAADGVAGVVPRGTLFEPPE